MCTWKSRRIVLKGELGGGGGGGEYSIYIIYHIFFSNGFKFQKKEQNPEATYFIELTFDPEMNELINFLTSFFNTLT